jgi:hypothetical protein
MYQADGVVETFPALLTTAVASAQYPATAAKRSWGKSGATPVALMAPRK